MRNLVLAGLAIFVFLPAARAQERGVALASEQATVVIAPRDAEASASLLVTLADIAPEEVTLRAVPLIQGQSIGFVRFPDNAGHDTIRLDAAGLGCGRRSQCDVVYSVSGMPTAGAYEGAIEAWRAGTKVASAPIHAVRVAPGFHPVLMGEQVRDGRISLELDGDEPKTIIVAVQNPAGSPAQPFELTGCAGASCPPTQGTDGPTLRFQPARFWLEPGASQFVSVTIAKCPRQGACPATVLLRNPETGERQEMVVSAVERRPALLREAALLIVALLGSIVSVILNNLFPTTRAKHAVREAIRRVEAQLRECPNAGNGLLDALRAEATRLRLVVRAISFASSTKQADLQDAQAAAALLGRTTSLAHRLSLLRTEADAAVMPLGAHGTIRGVLQDAEEALSVDDCGSAVTHLDEAQAQVVLARDDAQQTALKRILQQGIPRLLEERGRRLRSPADAPPTAAALPLQQPGGRDPLVRYLVERIDAEAPSLDGLDAQGLLDMERAFYLTDVWTEYVEAKMAELDQARNASGQPADDNRGKEWSHLFACLLRNLRSCPNADQTRLLIELVRHDTTLGDIVRALQGGGGRIDTSTQPSFLDPVDVAFAITDPVLGNVAAVRRLLDYEWSFGDGSATPPSVDRCRHYFQPPRGGSGSKNHGGVHTITVSVRVPFADAAPMTFSRDVTPRRARGMSASAVTDVVRFAVSAAIAMATAFAAKYSTSLPDVVTGADYLTGFLLGFGLDQLRDTVAPTSGSGVAQAPGIQLAPTPARAPVSTAGANQ